MTDRPDKLQPSVGLTSALFACIVFVVIPAATFVPTTPLNTPLPHSVAVAVNQLYVLGGLLVAGTLIRERMGERYLTAFTWCASIYYTAIYFMIAYQLSTGMVFEVRFVLDSLPDVVSTFVRVIGWREIASIAVLAIAPLFFQRWIWALTSVQPWGARIRPGTLLLALVVAANLLPQSAGYIGTSIRESVVVALQNGVIVPVSQPAGRAKVNAVRRDSLVFLQLESFNSVAAFGRASVKGKSYTGDYVPELRRLASNGVLFPYMWANGVQTSRALVSILCGVTGNLGPALTFHPGRIEHPCLPEVLKQFGYSSIFFNGFPNPNFQAKRSFALQKGFDDFLGAEIMKPDDSVAPWGYEECTFYRRVFEYLKNHPELSQQQFIHVLVSRHHYPFESNPEKQINHPIPEAATDFERYLNSLSEQDACLAVFWDEYEKYFGGDAHLFVLGDHSWGLGIDKGRAAYNDLEHDRHHLENFLTPLLYVPPSTNGQRERNQPPREDRVIGQADIGATATDILGLTVGGNSFAGLLRGDDRDDYDSCQLVAQPYGEAAIIVVRDSEKYAYIPTRRTVLHWTIAEQVNESPPTVVREDVSYAEFRDAYGCRRYNE